MNRSDETLESALPTTTARDQAWARAISSALAAGVRHSTACKAQPRYERCLPGCPWGEHVARSVAGSGTTPNETGKLHRCACADLGWVPVPTPAGARPSSRPCERCNKKSHQLWLDGHYRPNHTCPTCRPKGREKAEW